MILGKSLKLSAWPTSVDAHICASSDIGNEPCGVDLHTGDAIMRLYGKYIFNALVYASIHRRRLL